MLPYHHLLPGDPRKSSSGLQGHWTHMMHTSVQASPRPAATEQAPGSFPSPRLGRPCLLPLRLAGPFFFAVAVPASLRGRPLSRRRRGPSVGLVPAFSGAELPDPPLLPASQSPPTPLRAPVARERLP
ncbi:specifically androgen-regulated gene protein-like [Peromyscus leucopus]|uniref:specifically androgen-regulated gene protein-like n=1 Tax=Peromyscus leucopus TaxID=10041 RepID=UPI001884FD6F|nr:specifically androgen-regulated gene protein-like [Peromyscus leucopus]